MWSKWMAAFLRGKGQILWDVMVDTGYVQPMNFLTPGSRDMFDANNKAVDYLFHALCEPEFNRVHTESLACRIWSVLNEAHVGNAQVRARMYATYQREYENFTHLPGESIDALFQRFTVVVNNMRANVDVLPYNDHDRAVKLLNSLDRTVWGRKFEAIVELEKYDTMFSFSSFSSLMSMLGEEFDVLGENDLALLTKRFERLHENQVNMRRNTRTCFQCGKPGHFLADCSEKVENKDGYKHKSRTDDKYRSRCDHKSKHKNKHKDER
jgi:hypothetical protein